MSENKKTVNIIGAGVSGLAAASYLQMNGYDTQIFEKHSLPGGLCTSWKRKGYTFDGCIHWLLGSDKGSSFNILWNELLNMQDIDFVNHPIRFSIEAKNHVDKYGNSVFHLYSDLTHLEEYLKDIAEEDTKKIEQMIAAIRYVQKFEMPPLITIAPEVRKFKDYMRLVKFMPLIMFINKWGKVTNYQFAKELRNPFLKEVFELIFNGVEHSMLVIMMQLVYFDQKCGGYPIGGSYDFAKKLEQKYLALGGKILYNTKINKVIVEDNVAKGVVTNDGMEKHSDYTISACDWKYTIFDALDGKYVDKNIMELHNQNKLKVFNSAVLVSLGVSRSFEDELHLLRFPLKEKLLLPDGTEIERMEAHIYNYDATMAQQGKTVISVTLETDKFEYWQNLRTEDIDAYKRVKANIAGEVIKILDDKFGGIDKNVEVVDVATPATFYRYTNNWKGSIQGWYPPIKLFSVPPLKKELPGLDNFYMASHWSEPGGGLPIAIKVGRELAQFLCKKDKVPFAIR